MSSRSCSYQVYGKIEVTYLSTILIVERRDGHTHLVCWRLAVTEEASSLHQRIARRKNKKHIRP